MNSILCLYVVLNACFFEVHTQDNWKKRVRAYHIMEKLLPFSLPYLQKGFHSKDVDVSVNCDYILGKYYGATAKQKSQAISLHPWIDQLPVNYPNRQQIIDYYLAKARLVVAIKEWDWADFRFATYLFVTDLHRNYSTSKKVAPLLEKMLQNEQRWRIIYGKKMNPKIKPNPQPIDYNYRKFIKN